jgi:predicted O-linked N-acetylglucosamine transferase (SPINDLY family)
MKNKARFGSKRQAVAHGPRGQRLVNPPILTPDTAALLTQALAFHQAGLLVEAEGLYRKLLLVCPKHFDSLHMLGVIDYQRGDHASALRRIDHALNVDPRSASARNNRGVVLVELGRLADAVASYDKAIAFAPGYIDAVVNRGNALKELERFEEALASYDRAISLNPSNADAFNKRGNVLTELRRFDEAIASYERAIALRPAFGEAFNNRGVALAKLKRVDEAVVSYDKALALKPNYAEALNNRGQALAELRRFDEALASYDQAIALKLDYAEAFNKRGNVLNELHRFDEALENYERAIALEPDIDYLMGNRLHVKMHVCDWTDFDQECAALNAAVMNGLPASSTFPLLAIPTSAGVQLECAKRYSSDQHAASSAPLWRGQRYSHDRIRVAYLSADLHAHATAQLMAGLFEQHDKSRFETIAMSFGPALDSDMRQRLVRSFDRFIDVRALNDEAIAELIYSMEADIAVDLKGFTRDARTNILAKRPAPIQVSYLGYPGTMGANYIDYLIADRVVVPDDQHHAFSEKVVCLPDSYQVNDKHRRNAAITPSRTEAGLPEGGFVFCCFNNNFKITPDVFDVWMRLLREIQGSVLWLIAGNSVAPANLRREAALRGVAAERLIFAPRTGSEDHLARHRLADLFLDTYYCNAHTTASDALWAGVPLITCSGATFAGRVAGSLLTAVGLPELITHSLDDYEALALKLARDPALLAALRQKLACHRETYPLFNTERFARHIEAAYIEMWKRCQRGEPPQSFAVAPQN